MFSRINFRILLSDVTCKFAAWWSDLWFHWHAREGLLWVLIPITTVSAVLLGIAMYYAVPEVNKKRQIKCLALNIYHEARGEPEAGQYAVAEVTMNRVASKHYPGTVCEVVYQGGWDKHYRRYVGAFSWTELSTLEEPKDKKWLVSRKIAGNVYVGNYKKRVKGALFYHGGYIKKPHWAKRKRVVARIGRHIFY